MAEDEAAIRDCADRAYGRYVAAIGRRPAPMDTDYESQIASGEVYVAVDETGELQGFIVFLPMTDHMFLENVAVQPASSGCGIGKSLIRFCEGEALRLGLTSVRLYTNEKMTDNLSLYLRLGYVEVDRRTEDGFARVYFEKPLGRPT